MAIATAMYHTRINPKQQVKRKVLRQMGGRGLIGNGMKYLVPSRQPLKRHQMLKPHGGNFRTQHTGKHRGRCPRR